MVVFYRLILLSVAAYLSMSAASHIDDTDGELSKLEWDQVIFRLKKDCSMDRLPELKKILDDESVFYPKLTTYLSGKYSPLVNDTFRSFRWRAKVGATQQGRRG